VNGSTVTVASHKSIIGAGSGSGLKGIGLKFKGAHNDIVQNMNITSVTATVTATVTVTAASGDGDAIHVETGDHIWIDHNTLFSDLSHGTDYSAAG
jgi:pectate lyase